MRLSNIALAITAIYGGFSPANLFAGGVAGAWYDPSDLSTMFDTSAGTTPVAMPGQGAAVPVGLMLDKSQGLVLGSELVTSAPTNGTTFPFDTFTTSGVLITAASTSTSKTAGAVWNFGSALAVGTLLKIKINVNIQPGSAAPRFVATTLASGSGGFASSSYTLANGVNNITMLINIAAQYLQIGGNTGIFDFSVSEISVQAIAGNHAIAFNDTTARPELRARVNLLTYSEEFDNGAWTRFNTTVTPNTTVAPDGTTTADSVFETTTNAGHNVYQNYSSASGITYTLSWYVKSNGRNYVFVRALDSVAANAVVVDFVNKTAANASGTTTNISCTEVANGFLRVSFTFVSSATGNIECSVISSVDGVYANRAYAGDVTKGFIFWGADLRPANIGANVPAYQRIADALTYDTSGFPLYLLFEGAVGQRGMYTPASIPFATVTSDGQARRNLLSFPTAFDDAYWLKGSPTSVTVAANSVIDPFGGTNADTITETATTASHGVASGLISFVSGTSYVISAYAKNAPSGRGFFQLAGFGIGAAGTNVHANFDLVNGTVTAQSGGVGSIQDEGNGWYRCVFVFTCGTSTSERANLRNITSGTAPAFESYLGDITKSLYIYGAQLELGSTATAFQNIGTDKVAVFAGVRKLSDASQFPVIVELSNGLNAGAFSLYSNGNNANLDGYSASIRGSSGDGYYYIKTYASPITSVWSNEFDIAGAVLADENKPRINATIPTLVVGGAGPAGTGNFGTYPLYIGARNNSSLWFNGHLHSLIIAGSAVSASNISATEQWVAGKVGIQI